MSTTASTGGQSPTADAEPEEKAQDESKGKVEAVEEKDKDAPSEAKDQADGEAEEGSRSSKPTTVSVERKKDLLKKARSDRRKWIHAVPLPYRQTARDPSNVWTMDDRLSYFQSSPACQRVPTATRVLSELYGLENHSKSPKEVADRIESIVSRTV